jgi:hypothetical protein
VPIVDLLNGDPLAPFSDYPVTNASTFTGALDLVESILFALTSDATIAGLSGDSVETPRIFSGRDRRRSPSTTYPYAVLVSVSGRFDKFSGRGDSLPSRYFDLHWVSPDEELAWRLCRLSVARLRASAAAGLLDSNEGSVGAFLPSSTRAFVDPRVAEGVGAQQDIVDAFVQLHVVLRTNIG